MLFYFNIFFFQVSASNEFLRKRSSETNSSDSTNCSEINQKSLQSGDNREYLKGEDHIFFKIAVFLH